jgi:hypothetical protein
MNEVLRFVCSPLLRIDSSSGAPRRTREILYADENTVYCTYELRFECLTTFFALPEIFLNITADVFRAFHMVSVN